MRIIYTFIQKQLHAWTLIIENMKKHDALKHICERREQEWRKNKQAFDVRDDSNYINTKYIEANIVGLNKFVSRMNKFSLKGTWNQMRTRHASEKYGSRWNFERNAKVLNDYTRRRVVMKIFDNFPRDLGAERSLTQFTSTVCHKCSLYPCSSVCRSPDMQARRPTSAESKLKTNFCARAGKGGCDTLVSGWRVENVVSEIEVVDEGEVARSAIERPCVDPP